MKYKAGELCGFALHWAVAQVYKLRTKFRYESYPGHKPELNGVLVTRDNAEYVDFYSYRSTEFAFAIALKKISVVFREDEMGWKSTARTSDRELTGSTFFEAAARMIVHLQFPDGLDVPEELHFCCFKD